MWIVDNATTHASSYVEGSGKLLLENRVNFQTSDIKSDYIATNLDSNNKITFQKRELNEYKIHAKNQIVYRGVQG
jgi:hypothetical protein